ETGKPLGDGNPALKDPKFRHALGYAVDNARLAKSAFQGATTPRSTVLQDAYIKYHWKPPASQAFTFDLAKAGQLLDEAGHKKGPHGKLTNTAGTPLAPRP